MVAPVTERTRSRVESSIADLRGEYGEFDAVDKTWEHAPERYRRVRERADEEALGGAGVWLTNADGAVLLVRNEGDEGWGDPGGKREPDETYREAARRELREEAGVECEITGVLEVHVIEHRSLEPDDPTVFDLIVIFAGEYAGGEPRARDGEIADVGWFSEPPSTVLYDEVATRSYGGGA
ncbi:NUDIX hydrolase [Natronosalvus rutilus]|uniref:NUDIX hydrolase n=1 Tax=Natronosalvus rutilus TaxID=2953753 RepID=A0A9E7SUP9_9EURY|nr:NUDIX hydrolase [Natronosalvus rutilus]UTF53695.1 NUDIX hydrolase [Natronosalvus rutilus]